MKPSRKRTRRSPFLALLATLTLLTTTGGAELLERVIVRVNGDIITLSEFEARQIAAVQAARVGPDGIEAYLRENNARILQDAVDDLLLVQRADEVGLRLRPEYINEVIEGIKKENNIKDDGELQAQLRREGMSIDDLKRNIQRSILRRQVLSKDLEGKFTVTEAEARAEYEAKKKTEFTRNASVTLQEIVLGPEQAELARDLATRARGGEDFAALAKQHSKGATAKAGGDLGRLQRGELAPQLEAVAFALQKGAVSEPIPTTDGFRILRVVERTEEGVTPFEEVRAEITKRLQQERSAKGYEEYMEGLRKAASVHTMVREVPLQLSVTPPTPGTELGTPRLDLADPTQKPAPAAAAPVPTDPAGEFSVTPQTAPERVTPVPVPTPTPTPTPVPSPTPPPAS
jgi:parvulin-like peptidyl-prolyl isomerase